MNRGFAVGSVVKTNRSHTQTHNKNITTHGTTSRCKEGGVNRGFAVG